ncbi:MAG: TlpA disulfide reductase family protein [Myxococcales bacterium]|jgi:thiol-disulfide isomerase/thioredoxin
MRWVPFLVLLSSTVNIAACSRSEHAPRKASAPAGDRAAASFGPRVESAATEAPAISAEPSPRDAHEATPPATALPMVDAETLLQKIRDSGQRGVVVNAWASWCDPCREELPMLARVAPKLAARGVPIWLVSVDDPDGFAAAKALLDSLHITLPAFAAAPPLQDFKAGVNPNWPGMIPVSFLFDATGKLRYFWPGEVYEKELVPIVEGFVAGKHIDGTANFGIAAGATQGPGH